MKPIIFLRLIVLLLIVSFLSCDKQKQQKLPDPEFAAYVSHFTHGLIAPDAPLNITLASDANNPGESGSEISEELFTFNPAIKGKSYWIDARTIRFIPNENWPHDRMIDVSLFLNKLVSVPESFHIFRFQIQTLPLTFEILQTTLEVFSEASPDLYQLKGSVLFSESVQENELSKVFAASTKGAKRKIYFSSGTFANNFEFRIDSILRQKEEYDLLIEWNGGAVGSKMKGNQSVRIPALGSFEVKKIEVVNFPSQAIHVWFTDFLDDQQLLDGMIGLNPEKSVTFNRSNNAITIFPAELITGDFELRVAAGIKNLSGKALEEDFVQQVSFEQMKPEVKFVGKGTIMAGKENWILPFQAVGLRAVDVQVVKIFENNILQFLQWNALDGSSDIKRVGRLIARKQIQLLKNSTSKNVRWQTYAVDLTNIIAKDEAALYRIYLTFKKDYADGFCNGSADNLSQETSILTEKELMSWGESYYFEPNYYYPDNFNWSKRDDPCDESYYYYERFVSRNVLSTNMGIIAKQADPAKKEYHLYVNNLETTEPLKGVKVELFDYQQQSLGFTQTNELGMATLKLAEIQPFAAVASSGKQRSYLKLDKGSALSLSRFDVGGNAIEQGTKGFVFTERGVYRPGDTLFIGFILENKFEKLPDNYPVVLELSNARDQIVARQTERQLMDGMCLFKVSTSAEAPTGVWTAKIKAGNAVFSKRILVETVKPNRLKINFDFGKNEINVEEKNRAVSLRVNWLHGSNGANLNAMLERSVFPATMKFKGYAGYVFNDPGKYFSPDDKTVINGKTDAEGKWNFNLNLPDYSSAQGKLIVKYLARVMEPGGDFSTSTHSMEYHPFKNYIGLGAPEVSKAGYLITDEEHTFDVVSLSPAGKAYGNQSLKVEIFKLDWSWWWSGDGEGQAGYVSTSNAMLIHDETIVLKEGKASFSWKPKHPQWGNFFIRVSDESGGHSTGKVLYIDWPDWYSRSGRDTQGGASLLSISTDKENYKVGEKAIISFVSPGEGRALISIENGSRQLQSWWVDAKAGETSISIPLTSLFSPNVYAHITLLQPMKQLKNDMPVRSYGIVPLLVEDSQSRLHPQIKLPKETRAGTNFDVMVSEKDGKAMTYILAIVDEGILDLTNFKTPDPHSLFYGREALGIKSWDMYDFVLGAYGGRIEQVFLIGGDQSIPDREKARQSRFTPVVKVIGPFTLKAGKSMNHSLTIENYIGSVRAMVIASSGKAYGNAEQTMTIRQPLMVLATLPRLLRPNDAFSMPVTVFSSLKGAHEIKVSLSIEGSLSLIGSNQQTVRFDKEGEKMLYFDVKASENNGKVKVKVSASSGSETASNEVEIAVQNPNTRVYASNQTFLQPGQKYTHTLQFFGEENTHSATMEVSALPSVNLKRRLNYLIQYPYGCVEQIVSQGFAQLYLDKVVSLSADESIDMQKSLQSAIRQIVNRQRPDGSIAYWPGSHYVNEWSDIYAGHFMALAARENKPVPSLFLNQWMTNQKKKAQQWQPEVHGDRLLNDMIQAYRLYALTISGENLLSAMNRLRENNRLSLQAANILASAYAIAGQESAARELALGKSKRVFKMNHQSNFDSDLRDKAMRIETLLLLNEETLAFPLIKELSEALGSDEWFSTQSTAYGLYAWQLYAKKHSKKGKTSFVWGQQQSRSIELKAQSLIKDLDVAIPKVEISNTGENPIFVSWMTSGIPASSEFISFEKDITLSVQFLNSQDNPIDINTLEQGTAFSMQVVVYNPGSRKLDYLALNQIVPAGWEIVNSRLYADVNQSTESADYMDVRDDRIVYFFDLMPGSSRTFKTKLIATYEGKFLFPNQRCEAMYDPDKGAAIAGRWIEITRRK
ncbi:MAG: hypothetical protein CVT92_07850 [Bacteroidetes bacterium HGW-Bacteroidetes-1]|jgi:hypothetical protein|nr:MAG: hypothetical protein CVT92_07850 [Bacteroidetes bacterium HGW-Bacteroidetes-1]